MIVHVHVYVIYTNSIPFSSRGTNVYETFFTLTIHSSNLVVQTRDSALPCVSINTNIRYELELRRMYIHSYFLSGINVKTKSFKNFHINGSIMEYPSFRDQNVLTMLQST